MNGFRKLCLLLAIIGGVNWGLYGLMRLDLVALACGGSMTAAARIIYVVIGVAAAALIPLLFHFELAGERPELDGAEPREGARERNEAQDDARDEDDECAVAEFPARESLKQSGEGAAARECFGCAKHDEGLSVPYKDKGDAEGEKEKDVLNYDEALFKKETTQEDELLEARRAAKHGMDDAEECMAECPPEPEELSASPTEAGQPIEYIGADVIFENGRELKTDRRSALAKADRQAVTQLGLAPAIMEQEDRLRGESKEPGEMKWVLLEKDDLK